MTTYTAINLIKRPQAGPISAELFEVVQTDLPKAGPGEILVKITSGEWAKLIRKIEDRYFNTEKTDGYIRFNTCSKPNLEGSHGDHSITLKQGSGSDVFEEWTISESQGGKTDTLWGFIGRYC